MSLLKLVNVKTNGMFKATMGFNLYLGLTSPCPILVDTMAGSSIMVITTTLFMFLTTLLKELFWLLDCICLFVLSWKFYNFDSKFREPTLSDFLLTAWKVSFASVLRHNSNSMRLLLWYGAITQIGSFCGAIISYPLVNCIEGIFIPRYDCQACPWSNFRRINHDNYILIQS